MINGKEKDIKCWEGDWYFRWHDEESLPEKVTSE